MRYYNDNYTRLLEGTVMIHVFLPTKGFIRTMERANNLSS